MGGGLLYTAAQQLNNNMYFIPLERNNYMYGSVQYYVKCKKSENNGPFVFPLFVVCYFAIRSQFFIRYQNITFIATNCIIHTYVRTIAIPSSHLYSIVPWQ